MFDNVTIYKIDPNELRAVLDKNRDSIIHEIIAARIIIMATVNELTTSLSTLQTSVDALIAKPSTTGIAEAALDPIKSQMDSLNAQVQAALNPVTPILTDPAAPAV